MDQVEIERAGACVAIKLAASGCARRASEPEPYQIYFQLYISAYIILRQTTVVVGLRPLQWGLAY